MLILYQAFVSLLLLTSPFIIIYRIFKKKEDALRFKEKFSLFGKKRVEGKLIWFHGASVGEIMSIVPLIRVYEKNKSINQILVTSSTVSSSKIIEKFNFKKTVHQFYPIDHFYFTSKFLNYWKPNLAIFIESEIWPAMFLNLKRNNTKLLLLNARLTKKTFQRWMKLKKISKKIFSKISIAYPQNQETKNFIKKIGNTKIKTLGNLKFIEDDERNIKKSQKKLISYFKKRNVWVASSTHQYEEIFCAKTHIELKKKYKNLLTIIIPRHIHRSNKIVSEIQKLNLNVVKHSSKIKSLKKVDIYIVDTFGETKKFHKISPSVFLGGSIINRGGQNPLEAARYGAKIIHGKNIDNFKDIYKLLKKLKISKKISTPKQLASMIAFKKNKNIGVKIKNIGEKILKKTIKELNYQINNEFKKT
jgi:3-deoxy-D-manno-octulosonic-acid transferase